MASLLLLSSQRKDSLSQRKDRLLDRRGSPESAHGVEAALCIGPSGKSGSGEGPQGCGFAPVPRSEGRFFGQQDPSGGNPAWRRAYGHWVRCRCGSGGVVGIMEELGGVL